ncbi:MAG: hypothetical protein CMP12_03015 [Zunongwangia sp.]|uniref:Uncharacterized protein n=2 Tax=Zunongwangia profunda TaxID=398743 RepID=D5BJ36_ZUNPS|nr:hypothetical protein [Zunongwangia profunda]MAG86010.1 hypothetical protein [Flavobacteriaceae bacterium]MAO34876.1 hypothetical protein [Zunongwangia sp.]ADF53669.1 hypothetical protein ZPR_3353 [Zunongwangia profunda SM-A87]MAS70043.1 hypothetical protein [Zunongwangia sp.]MCC4229010.1 hypothetical protein [Zunongwangia profunda]
MEFTQQDSLQLIYNLGHPFLYRFSKDTEWVIFERFQHAVTLTSSRLISRISLKSSIPYNLYIINITKRQFLENRIATSNTLDNNLKFLFKEHPSHQVFHSGNFNLRIADVFKEINYLSVFNFLDYLKLEINIHELIFLHLRQYNKDCNNHLKLTHPSDVKQIKKAAELIIGT